MMMMMMMMPHGAKQKMETINIITINNEKNAQSNAKLRAGCSKAEPKKIRPAADPLPGGARRPKFNQLEMATTFTYGPSLVKIDARNFELSW